MKHSVSEQGAALLIDRKSLVERHEPAQGKFTFHYH